MAKVIVRLHQGRATITSEMRGKLVKDTNCTFDVMPKERVDFSSDAVWQAVPSGVPNQFIDGEFEILELGKRRGGWLCVSKLP